MRHRSWCVLVGALVVLSGCESTSPSGDSDMGEAMVDGSSVALDSVGDAAGLDGARAAQDVPVVEPEVKVDVEVEVPSDELFSFFVTSLEGMRELSGSQDGFGGDLGGLEGADEICRQLAAKVDAGHKTWRAFLSATAGGEGGGPLHAIERIGSGPWYDRNARLVSANIEGLLGERPVGDPQVVDDLPNEYGQGQKQFGDNHDTLTGSNGQGMLNDPDPVSTCYDWTSSVGPGSEKRVMGGHSWPRDDQPGGGPGGDGPFAPKPWVDACKGSSLGDGCSVNGPKAQFEGTCQTHPDDEGLVLCMPPDGSLPPGPGGGGGGGGGNDGKPWINAHTVPGCAPGVELEQVGGGQQTDVVGGGGGYGGIYCFALEP